MLARAIRGLVERGAGWLAGRRLHFLFVGDGLRMPEVEETLGGRKGPFHTLAGLVPQAERRAYLAASDIVLSPHVPNEDGSRFFGSPTKLFEYMAMGLPIVASELDQIGDVLQPGVRVSDLPSRSPDAAKGGRRRDAPGQRAASWSTESGCSPTGHELAGVLGANARGLATERYTWDAHVAAILERLDELCR